MRCWLYHFACTNRQMTVVELDAWRFVTEYAKRLVSWVNKALPILLAELKRLTPEDTWDMLNSFVVKWASFDWQKVVWVISNTAEHAIYVEYGVNWLTYNYHKPKWNVFYQWVGNRTFARAVDNIREKVINIIYQEINN